MLVRYHMTRAVRTFSPATLADEALREMRAQRFRFAPVVGPGEPGEPGAPGATDTLLGVVTERDLLRVLPNASEGGERPGPALLVAQAMTRDVRCIGPNAHVENAARLMFEHKFNGLPVVEGGRLLGVLTASDLLHTLMENDAAREGHRMTVLLPAFGPGLDLAAVCVGVGLRLNTLLRHKARGGAFLASVRVTGPWEAVDAFIQELRREGAILIEDAELREAG